MPTLDRNRLITFFLVISVISLSFIILPTQGTAEIRLTPRKVTFTPDTDGSYWGEFEITNDGDKPVKLSIRTSDWEMSEPGKVQLVPVGSTGNNSLSEWISGYPDRVEIQPTSSKKITFQVEVPPEKDKPRWGAFLIRPLREDTDRKEGLQVGVKVQYAVTLYQNTTGRVEKRGNIDRLNVIPGEDKETSIKIQFNNPSRAFLRPKGVVTVRTDRGEMVLEDNIEEFLVLPNHTRQISQSFEDLDSGRYRATVVLDYGAQERVGAKIFFNRD